MNPKDQLQSGNDYTPSARASAAVSKAHGMSSGAPDHADSGSVSAPSEADQPSNQNTGGAVKSNTMSGDQSFEQPSGGRGKVEKS